MRRAMAACVIAAATAAPAGAQDGYEAKLQRAETAAKSNAITTAGKQWQQKHAAEAARLMMPVLDKCLPEAPPDDIPTVFSVFVRLSAKGRAEEVVTDLDPAVSTCMTTAAKTVAFPAAPRDAYWVQLNMAAPL